MSTLQVKVLEVSSVKENCFLARRDSGRRGPRLQILSANERLHHGGEPAVAAVLLSRWTTVRTGGHVQRLPVPVRLAGTPDFPAFLPW